jgi:uncharacterized protein YodC (DUF2158 family)
MSEFKTGVVVELKSGGPPMTCANTPCPETGQVQCLWFVGGKLQRDEFPQESLAIVERVREYTEREAFEARRLAHLLMLESELGRELTADDIRARAPALQQAGDSGATAADDAGTAPDQPQPV